MKPVHCRIAHEPENGKYGDCVRACIASLLELPAEDVPHFYEDDPGGDVANERIKTFLATKGFVPFWTFFDGETPLQAIFDQMLHANAGVYYMLFHETNAGGDHVVICQNDAVDFDPAWYRSGIKGPNSNGFWGVMVIAIK